MAEVTEADREKAWVVLAALPISIPGYSPDTVDKARNHLAAALAEEREKARAPFLALAASYDDMADVAKSETWRYHADRIRRTAEESG